MKPWIVSYAVWGLYIAALALPAAVLHIGCGPARSVDKANSAEITVTTPEKPRAPTVITGIDALRFGWDGLGAIPELANVALLIGWVAFILRQKAVAAV